MIIVKFVAKLILKIVIPKYKWGLFPLINMFLTFIMRYIAFSLDKLRQILKERGLKDRDLVKMMYGKDNHQSFSQIFTKTFGVQKLVSICNVLDIPMDMLFDTDNNTNNIPNISGNNNNVNNINSTIIQNDFALIKSENDTLKMLINEKDERIKDLQKSLEKVLELVKLGQ